MSHKDIYGYKDTYGYIWMYGYGFKDMDIRIYIWLELKSTHAINIFFWGHIYMGGNLLTVQSLILMSYFFCFIRSECKLPKKHSYS